MAGKLLTSGQMKLSSILLLLLISVLWGCGSKREELSNYNVLLITLDTLRADFLSCYNPNSPARTPNLDRLAKNGAMFERAFTTVPLTLPAHASLMTSRYPIQFGVRTNNRMGLDAEETTLAEIFQSNGYDTAGIISAFPVASVFGMNQGFEYYGEGFLNLSNPQFDMNLDNERSGAEVNKEAFRWLENHHDRPFFLWLHYFDAHAPYKPPEEFRAQYPEDPYAAEVAFVDRSVGEIVDRLKDLNLLDKTIIVICSDHGEGLGDHGENGHGLFVYNYAVHIPLIIYAKGLVPPKKVNSAVSILDVAPTLLSLLGLKSGEAFEGEDLAPLLFKNNQVNSRRSIYSETYYPSEAYGWSSLFSLTDGKWKYILAPQQELYHLTRDMYELNNLVENNPEEAQFFKGELQALIERQEKEAGKNSAPTLDQRSIERLKSLGYVAGAVRSSGSTRVDPKDRVSVYQEHRLGLGYLENKQYEDALDVFQRITAVENDNPLFLYYLAEAQMNLGKDSEAENTLKRLLSVSPGYFHAVQQLAQRYERRNETEKAVEFLDLYINKYPEIILYRYELWNLYTRLGQWEKALEEMRSESKKHPENIKLQLKIASVLSEHKRYGEALLIYERLREAGTVSRDLLDGAAKTLLLMGRLKEAENAYLEIIGDDPENYEAHLNLGMIYSQTGRYQEGVASCRRALHLQPDNAVIQFDYAYLLLLNGQVEQAIKEFDKALILDPSNWKVHMALGLWFKEKGRLHEARAQFEEGLKIIPGDANFAGELRESMRLIDRAGG